MRKQAIMKTTRHSMVVQIYVKAVEDHVLTCNNINQSRVYVNMKYLN